MRTRSKGSGKKERPSRYVPTICERCHLRESVDKYDKKYLCRECMCADVELPTLSPYRCALGVDSMVPEVHKPGDFITHEESQGISAWMVKEGITKTGKGSFFRYGKTGSRASSEARKNETRS